MTYPELEVAKKQGANVYGVYSPHFGEALEEIERKGFKVRQIYEWPHRSGSQAFLLIVLE